MKQIPLLLLIVLAGCAGIMNATTRESVAAKTRVKADSFKKTAWLKGPIMRANLMREAAKKDERTKKDFLQLYISHQDTNWIFFDNAVDSDGKKMEFNSIGRETSQGTQYGVGVIEDFAISVSEDYLATKAKDGLLIRAYGKNGARTIAVPAFYVKGFLDSYRTFAKKPRSNNALDPSSAQKNGMENGQ